jgi:hypothetical protein
MIVLRATRKVLKSLPQSASDADVSDTALGDWYVNRMTIDRQPLLLLVSAKSLLAILTPARAVKALPDRIGEIVACRLARMGIDEDLIRAEVKAMGIAVVGRTLDRSVTGQMVDFAKVAPSYIPIGELSDSTLRFVEDRLGETPCRCTRSYAETVWPAKDAARLLAERWSQGRMVH